MTTAAYAGSFDPATLGHLDAIERALKIFDHLIVAIGVNSAKTPMFTLHERQLMIELSLHVDQMKRVTILPFQGLLVDFCREQRVDVVVRGLRAISDFESEMAIAHVNHQLAGYDTVFLPTRPSHSFISSSTVKEIIRHSKPGALRENLKPYVSPEVLDMIITPISP
jgi:pantetheine-phosphate adenylyltransferase